MSFIKKTTNIDFGQTSIENIFINDFMPMADGTHVKVYLLGYKYANDNEINFKVNNQTIANHLEIPLVDVLKAWDFWEKLGIIKRHQKTDIEDSNDYTVEFISLRQLYIDNNYSKSVINNNTSPSSSTSNALVKDLLSANKVPEIKDMFYNIQQLIRRPLSTNEKTKVLNWISDYGITPDIITRAFQYSIEQRGVKNLSYIAAIIRNWYDKGIITLDKVDAELAKSDERFSAYIKIMKFLGLNSTIIGDHTKSIIDKWFDTWGFTLDMILKACENTVNISNPNINYIDKILEDWYNNGVKTVTDAKDRKKDIKKDPVNSNPKKKTKDYGTKNNKFHNFEQKYHKYSNDDFEKFMNNKKNK